jgi:hypothetical protein
MEVVMFIKSNWKNENRLRYFTIIGAAAQISLVASIMLSRLSLGLRWVDFVAGLLLGFSMVGNLAYLIYFSRQLENKSYFTSSGQIE